MKKKLFGILIIVCILSLILVACGTSVDVTINFDSNGGSAVSSLSLGNDMTITMPEDPTKDGYVFAGWYWDNNTFQEEFTAGSLLTAQLSKDMTVYAKWISEEQSNADFTVTFNSKSGTLVEAITTSYGSLLLEPTAPTRSGFYFGGWFRDEACLNKWDFSSDTVVRDITLYAKWIDGDPTDRTYTVVFYYNGDIIDKIQNVSYNSTISEISAPVKPGYVFKGWYTSEAYTNRWYFDEDVVKGTTKLYAKYIPEAESTYTVEFNTNGGTAIESYYDVLFNSTISKPGNSLKDGYAVTGWYTDSTLSTEWNFESDVVRSNLVLYAKWAEADTDACDIIMAQGLTINAEQKEVYGKVANVQKTISFFDIIEVSPFASWSVYNDLQGKDEVPSGTVELPVGDTVKYILVTSYDNSKRQYYKITVRRRDIYSITVVPNNGDENYVYQIEEDDHITPPTLLKKGYSIEKWVANNAIWNMKTDVVSSDTIINTVWKANTYAVTFNSNGGNDIAETSVTYDAGYSFTVPEKTGYTFIEWYYENANEEIALTDGLGDGNDVWNIDSDIEIFARWQATVYSITYQNTKNAVNNNPKEYTIEDEITFESIEKDGYIFVKWTDEDENAITGLEKGSLGNRIVVADWRLMSYTATFKADGVTLSEEDYTVDDAGVSEPNIPEKTGYTSAWETYSLLPQNITINAVYTPIVYTITYEGVTGQYDVDSPVNNNVTTYTIESPTITLSNASKTAYMFNGWTESGEPITQIHAGSTGNRTIVANWTAIEYSIEYTGIVGNYDVDIPINGNVTTYTVESATIVLTNASKTGYTFNGWQSSGVSITKIPAKSYGNKTITANWTPIVYTITYEGVTGQYDVDTPVNNNVTTYTIESATITLSNASKTAYTFDGWTENGTPVTQIPAKSYGNKTITANWTAISYDITFIMENEHGEYEGHYDGDANPTAYTVEDSFVFIEPVSDIRGYTFKGWYTTKNEAGVKVDRVDNVIGHKTYYAQWTREEYTITYYNIDHATNSNLNSYNVETPTFTLEEPTKLGYSFLGWYTSDEYDQIADTTIEVGSIGNLEFFAKWELTGYTIEYVLYGGTNNENNPAAYTMENSVVFQAPTRDNYTFAGWYTDSNFKNSITGINFGTRGNITLYAKWHWIATVTFNSNGGSAVEAKKQAYGTTLTAPTAPTRDYYTFVGWFSDLSDSNPYVFGTMPDMDFTLIAKWSPVVYTINYHLNGGVNGNNPTTYTVEDAVILKEATKTGYSFVAWYRNAEFTSEPVDKITIGTHGTIDLYANYSINEYTISFNSNGGSAVTPITQDYDTFVDAPADPAKLGYRFLGWYRGNDKYTFNRMPAEDITLTARWETITYTISYGLDGGMNGNNPGSYTIESSTITFVAATKRGYSFVGWFDGDDQVTQIPHGSYGAVELQARYQIINYTITYNNAGESNTNPATYTVEDVFNFTDIEKLGHTYHGLFTESTFVNQKTGIAQGTIGNIVLYAKYTVNSYDLWMDGKENPEYTISFDVVGGKESYEAQIISSSAGLTYPGSPTKEGYIFAGWYDNDEYTGTSFAFDEEVNRNVILFAKWVACENNIISVNDTVTVEINGKTELLYSFIPLVSGDVSMTTTGSIDTYGSLYEGETLIKQDDDNGSDSNFLIKYNVTAGKLYTISVRGYSVSTTGNVTLSVAGNVTVPAGGKAQEAGNKITVTFGQSFTLSVPTKDGYVFRGWADENGVMYTDDTGASIKNFDKGEETVFYSQWDFDGFTVSFITNGGTAVEDDVLARGARLDINKYVTTRANYSFLGWFLSVSDTESYNASVMPDHDVTLYARWTSYALNAIKYDESINYISQYKEITAEDFGATCFDNGGNLVPLTVAISGTQEAGNTITVRFTATNNGKTKTATISGVQVYGYPTLTIGENKDYFNLKDGLTASWFSVTAKDTYNTAIAPVVYIEGDYAAGDTVTVKVKATDIAGNVTEQTIENIKVYGAPVISSGTVTAIKVSDTLTPALLAVTAQDSFGVSLTPTTTLYSGTQSAGKTIRVKLYAIDSKGNTTTEYIDVKVYGLPTISAQTTFDFKVEDVITPASLGLSATDSHGGVAVVAIELTSGTQTAGQTLTFAVTATDIVGNVATSTATAKIYGAPTVTYNRNNVLVNENIQNTFIHPATLSFNLNGGTSGKPADQRITETQGMVYPSTLPTRSGYAFRGWYTTSACTTFFDFTKNLTGDTTVYAGWQAMATSNYYTRQHIDARSYNSSSNAQSISMSGTSSSAYYYTYFTALTAGTYYIYYKNSSSSSSYYTYAYIYNVTKGSTIKSNGTVTSTSYSSVSFTANAGDVIYIRNYRSNTSYSPTFYFYVTGAGTPSSGGKVASLSGENDNTLHANAIDSFGKTLEVSIALKTGDISQKATYVTYDITATDHLGNTTTITTAELGVYDIEDVRSSLVYNPFNTDKIKVSSHGEEFETTATDSFGNACTITLKQANGNALVAGQVQNIVVVATDIAGNEVTSDQIANIGVYDIPTISYDSEHIDGDIYFIRTDEDYEFLFTGFDSFGEELYVSLETIEETEYFLKVSASTTDDAGNIYESEYTLLYLVTISTTTNMPEAGTYTQLNNESTYSNTQYTLLATTNNGYTWLGWYDGETKVSEDDSLSYTFTMGTGNKTYTAKWYKIRIKKNINEAGTVTVLNDKYVIGDTVTVTASTNNGYTWLGWYDGETKVSEGSSLNYTFTMGTENKTYTAKWEIWEELQNFNFTSTSTTLTITGVKDKAVTQIILPEYVTQINSGAFSGCSSLESITLPFIGGNRAGKTSTGTYQYPLGYIFGESSYAGGKSTKQYYYGSSTSSTTNTTYYIPSSLRSVTVTGGYIPYGAFYGCSSLTSVTLGNGVTSIGSSAFYGCSSLTSVTLGNGVTSIGSNAFDRCDNLQFNEYDNGYYLGNENNPYLWLIKAKNTSITSCTIHEDTKCICQGAFSGCSSLKSITLPFIGNRAGVTSNDTYQYPLGYIFGTSSYTGGTSTGQDYYGSSTSSPTNTTYYIPSSLRSVTVTSGYIPQGALFRCSSLTSVTIGNSVTSIGGAAFAYCSSLTSITIPDSVPSIGSSAFYGCRKLTSITIPNSVTSIGGNAFIDCSSLTSITIPSSVTSIGSYAFKGCSGLTSITIPDSVTSIGGSAFDSCDNLQFNEYDNGYYLGNENNPYLWLIKAKNTSITSCTIHEDTKFIANGAFEKCSSLTSITIPDSVPSIGDLAFYDCSGLTSITIGNGVTSIGNFAFSYCSSLTSVYYTGDIASWCAITFSSYNDNPLYYAHNLYINNVLQTEIVIPDTVTEIKDNTFWGWNGTSITIPDSVTSIGIAAFEKCSSLTSITIGNGVTSIGRAAFANCSSLTSITIPDSVTSIGDYAFDSCDNLQFNEYDNGYYLGNENNPYLWLIKAKNTSITSCAIHEDTKCIYQSAFYNCAALTSVTIPDSVTSIGGNAFLGCRSLQYNEYDNGYYLGNDNHPYIILIKAKNTSITSCTIHEDTKFIYGSAFRECSSLTSITIPDSVTSIGYDAFYNCSRLGSITIPDGVTSIGSYAFSYCSSLTSVTIGNSVTSIGEWAFSNCSSLTSVYYTGDIASWCGITFGDYNSNPLYIAHNLYINNELVKEIVIPDTVTEIKACAFYGWNGTSITIPDSVPSIGSLAFRGCTKLKNVIFGNTNGWYVTATQGATSGTNLSLTNTSTNATYLKDTYYNYYWYRK